MRVVPRVMVQGLLFFVVLSFVPFGCVLGECAAGSQLVVEGATSARFESGGQCANFVRDGTTGQISDGEGNYGNLWYCHWVITANVIPSTISVWIDPNFMINIEKNYDFISIWACNGACSSRTQLARFSGYMTFAQDPTRWTSHTGISQVEFTSDRSVTKGGFIMLWGLQSAPTSCGACESGKYKDSKGSQGCTNCPVNSGVGGTGSIRISACQCNQGFSGPNGGACSACVPGTYKGSRGPSPCLTCDTATVAAVEAATSCPEPCPAGQLQSPIASNVARMCGPAEDQPCPTKMSSTHRDGPALHGNDGITNSENNYVHANSDGSEWFKIDFQQTRQLDHIIFFYRPCCASRSLGAEIRVGMSLDPFQNTQCAVLNGNGGAQTHSCQLKGRYIFITHSGQYLNFNELQAFSAPPTATGLIGIAEPSDCQCLAGSYEATHVLNPAYAARRYSSDHNGVHHMSALDDLYSAMSWATQNNGFEEWMEINAGSPKHVVGVITQGRGSSSPGQFVTRFRVEYRLGDSLASSTVSVPGSFDTGSAKQALTYVAELYGAV